MTSRILIVEDDAALARVLTHNLQIDGFEVSWTANGNDALQAAQSFMPDLILLDIMLPGRSGFELCPALRQSGKTPIIMLSVRGQKMDKIRALDLGADDYMTKPFDVEELAARIRVVLRRVRAPVDRIRLGDVSVDFRTLRATGPHGELHLTHREFEILRYLAVHHEHVVSRSELLRGVWQQFDSLTRPIDNAIARLRKKIEPDPRNPRFVHTVRGDGYALTFESE